jgi:two-component system cell cycle response regulator DivK
VTAVDQPVAARRLRRLLRTIFAEPQARREIRPAVTDETRPLGEDADPMRAATIFIVEDDRDVREMYARYLSAQGFRVDTASDGASAFARIVENRPDLIVTDLSLPRLTGWELTRRLKRDPRTIWIPVIACTGHVLGWAVEHALDAGCDAYVIKPCLPADLAAEIRRVLAAPSVRPRTTPSESVPDAEAL